MGVRANELVLYPGEEVSPSDPFIVPGSPMQHCSKVDVEDGLRVLSMDSSPYCAI